MDRGVALHVRLRRTPQRMVIS